MENPIKTATNFGAVIRWAILGIVVFAILDVAKLTDWVIYPVWSFQNKFMNKKSE